MKNKSINNYNPNINLYKTHPKSSRFKGTHGINTSISWLNKLRHRIPIMPRTPKRNYSPGYKNQWKSKQEHRAQKTSQST